VAPRQYILRFRGIAKECKKTLVQTLQSLRQGGYLQFGSLYFKKYFMPFARFSKGDSLHIFISARILEQSSL